MNCSIAVGVCTLGDCEGGGREDLAGGACDPECAGGGSGYGKGGYMLWLFALALPAALLFDPLGSSTLQEQKQIS